jgi:anti-sigma regulatory factor (Ser/Thr protein kinase)
MLAPRFSLVAPASFQHEVLHYRGDEQFTRVLTDFIRQGLAEDESVAVAETPRNIGLLRDALGADGAAVRFVDQVPLGGNPARIISFWHDFCTAQTMLGRRVRGVGEPAWPGRSDSEIGEVRLHELLVNRAFDSGPGWRLLCPYDAERLPASVLSDSLKTHPFHLIDEGGVATEDYRTAGIMDAFAAPLSPAPDMAARHYFHLIDIGEIRRLVAERASDLSVPGNKIDDLVLAISEIATNSVKYGGGAGVMLMWTDAEGLQVEFQDTGHILEPLAGRRAAPAEALGGRGVYLANQVSDLVQLRSSRTGTTVRISTWI